MPFDNNPVSKAVVDPSEFEMPYGKHAGVPIAEVPTQYLSWVYADWNFRTTRSCKERSSAAWGFHPTRASGLEWSRIPAVKRPVAPIYPKLAVPTVTRRVLVGPRRRGLTRSGGFTAPGAKPSPNTRTSRR